MKRAATTIQKNDYRKINTHSNTAMQNQMQKIRKSKSGLKMASRIAQ